MMMLFQRVFFFAATLAIMVVKAKARKVVPAPGNVQIKNVTTDSVIVTYELNNQIQAYTRIIVILFNRETRDYFQLTTAAKEPVGKFQLKDLESGTKYTVKMTTRSPDNQTSETTEKDFVTAGPKPVGHLKVHRHQITETTAQVSWPANPDPVDEYEVTVTNSSGQTTTKRVSGNVTATYVMNLNPDTSYSVKVTAIKNRIKGLESDTITFTTKQKVLVVTTESKINTTSYTTPPTVPITGITNQPDCPDLCEEKGVQYGNIAHPTNRNRFIQCSFGRSFGCNNCAPGTSFVAAVGDTPGGYCA